MHKRAVDELALFGGPKLFASPRPIGQLDAPPVEEYLALLRVPFEARYLSNDGPLVTRLEERLQDYHAVRHCIAVANAGLGLTMLMQLFARGREGEVVMPAFSYRGLPHFAQWAGQLPRFCDVDPVSHTLDPVALERCVTDRTTSILAVCNFNSPGALDEIFAVGERRNVPVLIDSVYGLGSSYKGKLLGGFGHAEVYSMHATKLLNGFEGGYITTNDDGLAAQLRWQRKSALHGLRPPSTGGWDYVLGLNAKLNELHAAMALLSLDRLERVINRNRERYEAYRDALAPIHGVRLLPYLDSASERRNFQMAVIEVTDEWPLTRDDTLALLRAEGAAISPYYSPPLHKSPHAPTGIEVPDLPVSEHLATRFIQLPVGELVSREDISEIGSFLRFIRDNHTGVAACLKAAT